MGRRTKQTFFPNRKHRQSTRHHSSITYNSLQHYLDFTAALFAIAKIGKQPKCPSVDEWIKLWIKLLHICNGILHVCSVMSDSLRPHGLQHARLLCPRYSPGKNTIVGCHFLLQQQNTRQPQKRMKICHLQQPGWTWKALC